MNDDQTKQEMAENQDIGNDQCGPGCNCERPGLSTRAKAIICLVVAIVAMIVLMRSFESKAKNATTGQKPAFNGSTVVASAATQTNQTDPLSWGGELHNLASLDTEAAGADAVFVYLPKKGEQPNEIIKKSIKEAAAKAQNRGIKMSLYMFDTSSKDYAEVTKQSPAPCVLVMVKGIGKTTVSGELSEKKLLEAIVSASRASSCGPSGCGPSGCK